ncbi:hypothetical protein [Stigmatella erecta]|uniref:Uncharacterized protein n=1 Tax=Stigmatella erecta TaxID=83460 RepID=A0A1I0CW19_9BACT|nr:hypothetical protein [Stigmatella erecta]SET23506.1 hypothetical protein SAMN05443639_102262 [Stigmatella erecta]
MKKVWVFAVLLALGAGAAYHFGYLTRWWQGPRFIPKDPALLAYFRPDTSEWLLVQATQLDLRVSAESQAELARQLQEFHAKTGIDVRRDVDAAGMSLGLAAVRGRFDWDRLSAHLQSQGYSLTTLGGVPAAVKSEAVDVALDGRYLLLGPQGELELALSRKRQGEGLGNGSPMVKALDELGWEHAMLGGMVSGPLLSLVHEAVALRAESLLGVLDVNAEGAEVRGIASTNGRIQAELLRAALEVARKALLLSAALDATAEGRTLRASLESATLETDAQGRVRGFIRFPHALTEQASGNLSRYSAPEPLQKWLRLFEGGAPAANGAPPAASPPAVSSPVAATTAGAPVHLDWKPPVLGLVLLVFALVTMGAQTRPGMFNVLFHPLFLLPFLASTLGVFVFRWTGHAGGAFDVLALPMPEWHRFVAYPVAQTVALSAAVPLVFALLSAPVRFLRPFAAGLGVGFSAYLAVKALAAVPVPLIPPVHALSWYVGNAVAALLIARLALPPRRSKEPQPRRGPGSRR